MEHIARALNILRSMRMRPRMFAIVREAFLSEVTGILHVCVSQNNHDKLPELYAKYGPRRGSMILNMDKEVDDDWARDVIDEAIDCIEHDNSAVEEAWTLTAEPPMIAGPWVPFKGKGYRYNRVGQPLACASSQKEIPTEDARLEALGYKLTDKNRTFPEHFFTWKPHEEE